jgi:endonuclease-8
MVVPPPRDLLRCGWAKPASPLATAASPTHTSVVPEGDTLHRAAARVGGALIGDVLVAVAGSHPSIQREGGRLRGGTVTSVEAIGKHLLVHTDAGWSLRTHLGMTGRWDVYAPTERWRTSEGKARVVLRTQTAVAVCFAAPTVAVGLTGAIMGDLDRLGPDLATPEPDGAAIVQRARAAGAATMADLLLDQTVASGIGNVYKSEILYLERVDPGTDPIDLADDELRKVYARANRLLLANLTGGARTTTGNRGRGNYWVYGRGGKSCRRCGTIIATSRHGDLARRTYWCPTCQPQRSTSSRSVVKG